MFLEILLFLGFAVSVVVAYWVGKLDAVRGWSAEQADCVGDEMERLGEEARKRFSFEEQCG